MICEFDPNEPHELKVRGPADLPPVPMLVGILIGEICYNLRSAMDFLAYNLSWLDSGRQHSNTQFPIESKPEKFAGRKDTWLKGIDAAHVADIEILQPYNGCKWTEILRNLSNWDKHRDFTRIQGSFRATALLDTHPAYSGVKGPIRRAEHPIFGVMGVKLDFALSIELPNRTPVAETLEIVKLGVSEALECFEPDFP